MNAYRITTTLTTLVLAACLPVDRTMPLDSSDEAGATTNFDTTDDSDEIGDTSSTTDTGNTETTDMPDLPEPDEKRWAEVTCVELMGSPTPICMGRHAQADDAWTFVQPVCHLDATYTSPEWVVSDVWGSTTCAPGLSPDPAFWDQVRCYQSSSTTLCFGVLGEWATPLAPVCQLEKGTAEPWPAATCVGAAAGSIGGHPWDDVWCYDNDYGSCYAEQGGALMLLEPTCWVDERPVAEPPACVGG